MARLVSVDPRSEINPRLVGGALHAEPVGRETHDRQPSKRREPPGGVIRVMLMVGRSLVTAGYRALLERDRGIEIVGEAASAQGAVELVRETGCMVALLDQELARLEGLETTTAVVSRLSSAGVAVLLIAGAVDDQSVLSAVRAGAAVVLRTDEEPTELIVSVRLAAQGKALLPASAMRRLLDELSPRPLYEQCPAKEIEELTAREREVVGLVARGLTNGEIATQLVISPKTAKTHVSRAMQKLAAHHRAQLVAVAYEHGLVMPPPTSATPAGGENAEGGTAGSGRRPRRRHPAHGHRTAALSRPWPASRPAPA
jgi:DNA-binding NarL/FixJ family response regulator